MSRRPRDPERTNLRVEEWPAVDAELWRAACAPGSLLDEETGARVGCRPASNEIARKGYGRWLGHLAVQEPQALALPARERITAERVKAYVARLDAQGLSTTTVITLLQGLVAVAKVVAPDCEVGVVNRIAVRVRARHKPARDKTCKRLSNELVDLGFALMKGAADRPREFEGAIQYRDGLLISFLALVPLRRSCLAGLVLGRSLVRQGRRYVVSFAEGETKTTNASLELLWPDGLVDKLEVYLNTWRPVLAGRTGRWTRDATGALWISKDGSPMTEMAIYDRIRARTREAFGEAINPHAFRHAAATTQAIADPARVRIAAPLLGHRSFATTERFYQLAGAHVAQRSFLEVIEELREKSRGS
jgi:site-specific recombinase XerC